MKRILTLLFFALILSLPQQVLATPRIESGTNVTLSSEEIIDGDYFAGGDAVTVSGTVNGDVYVGGGSITIDGTVNGDVLVAGGTIKISGTVNGDVRAAGGTIIISGPVSGNVTLGAGTVHVLETGLISGSLVGGVGTLDLAGPVGRDVTLGVGALRLDSSIGGDLNYWSEAELTESETASVAGETTFSLPPEGKHEYKPIAAAMIGAAITFYVIMILGILIVGAIFIKAAPRYTSSAIDIATQNPWLSLLVGFGAMILIPAAIIALFISVLGIPLAITSLLAFVLFLMFSKIFTFIFLGALTLRIFTKNKNLYGSLFLGALVYSILYLIPLLGWIAQSLLWLISFGALLIHHRNHAMNLRAKKLV